MFILDVQGFQYTGGQFICKEICIVNTVNGEYFHTLVKLPHPMEWFTQDIQTRMRWLTINIHGLEWDQFHSSSIPYDSVTSFIKNIVDNNKIFVKGCAKKNWLSKLVSNEIEEFVIHSCPNLPALKKLNKHCNFHCLEHFLNDKNCGKEHALLLYTWYINKNS